MKKTILALAAVLVLGTCLQSFAGADDKSKDECLLSSKSCANQVDTIQKRIRRINAEIKKGTKVYSALELKKLEQKLNEADDILKQIEKK